MCFLLSYSVKNPKLHPGESGLMSHTPNMAAAGEAGGKDEVKTQYTTREGTYKLMTLSEYSRPTRVPYNVQCCHPVKVSFTSINDGSGCNDKICFNVGRELYFYPYKGVRKVCKSWLSA